MICSIQIRIVDRLNLALYSSSQFKVGFDAVTGSSTSPLTARLVFIVANK